ncbi:endonuclease domain-containing protein [Corynebacterium hindlerae]|uniref:endonuclease domain-containing protein n=1 Tax=Corynebacterium hindlerae TaxID=699041 RepID=UPI003AAB19F2
MGEKIFLTAPMPVRRSDAHRSDIRSGELVRFCQGIYFPAEADINVISLSRAAFLKFDDVVIGGWAALVHWGVPFWLDAGHFSAHSQTVRPTSWAWVTVLGTPNYKTSRGVDPLFPGIRVVDLATATIDCLQDLWKNRHSWWVPKFWDIADREVRCVQLIDAVRRHCGLTITALKRAARDRFCQRRLRRLLRKSALGADSPQETLMRLAIGDLGGGAVPQYEVFSHSGKLITIIDLAFPGIKVAVYYDGHHHLDRKRRDRDSEINAALQERGWTVFRVTTKMLARPGFLRHRVKALVQRAEFLARNDQNSPPF